jgi:polyisoprenoid-binding protein YceI
MTDSTGTQPAGTYEFGPESGRVLVKTSRQGMAAVAGHDLTLEVTDWLARVSVPGDIAGATVTADLGLGSLAVREATGGARPLTDRDRRDIEKQARKVLGDTARAQFTSRSVVPYAPSSAGAIEGTLTMHGVSRGLRLEIVGEEPGHYRGTATIRQTDFGITPYSGFFGALKVSDEVTVEFEVIVKGLPNGSG